MPRPWTTSQSPNRSTEMNTLTVTLCFNSNCRRQYYNWYVSPNQLSLNNSRRVKQAPLVDILSLDFDYAWIYQPVTLPSLMITDVAAQDTFSLLPTKIWTLEGCDLHDCETVLAMVSNFPHLDARARGYVKHRVNIMLMAAVHGWHTAIALHR